MQQNEFIFNFKYTDLFEYAHELASKVGVSIENNVVKYPSHIADGYCKFFKINEFMSYQVVHYTAKQKMIFNKFPSVKNHITITYQDFTFAKCNKHDYDCNEIILNNDSLGSIQCKSTKQNEIVIIEPGLEVKVVLVLMKENWVDNVLHETISKEKFIRYLVNENANIRKEFLNVEQRKFFNELFICKKFTLLESLYYEGRIFNLLESFLNDILY